MSRSTKRFIGGYVAIYMATAIALNVFFGPPGMPREYLDQFKADHDRYLSITKSLPYKLWAERPELNQAEEDLADDVAFVVSYSARPEFVKESRRRSRYDILFDVLNSLMVVVLIVRFARKPFLRFVDGRISEVRHRLDRVERAREETKARRQTVEARLEGLPKERELQDAATATRIAREQAEINEATQLSLRVSEQETRDRKRYEETLARRAVKAELVDEALSLVAHDYAAKRDDRSETQMIERFLLELDYKS